MCYNKDTEREIIKMERYSEMLWAFKTNQITEKQWNEYCLKCLATLMKDNKAVLERLKECE